MTGVFQPVHVPAYLSITASTPGFWSPIEFSIPPGVSVTRGVTLPIRGLSVVPLQQIAPSRSTSTTSPYSTPYPNVPDATRIGFSRTRPRPRSTDRSTSTTGGDVGGDGAISGRRGVTDRVRSRSVRSLGARLGTDGRASRAVVIRRFAFTSRPPS